MEVLTYRWLVTVTYGTPSDDPVKIAHLVGVFDTHGAANRCFAFTIAVSPTRTACIIRVDNKGRHINEQFFYSPFLTPEYAETDDGLWETWAAHEKEAIHWHRFRRDIFRGGAEWGQLNLDDHLRSVALAAGIDTRTPVSNAPTAVAGQPLELHAAPGG